MIVALVALNAWLWVRGGVPAAARAVEVTAPAGRWEEPLEPPRLLTVSGPLGETVVALDEARCRIVASPCPLQLCVRAGPATRSGALRVCLPNRVAVRLLGGREEGVDAVGR